MLIAMLVVAFARRFRFIAAVFVAAAILIAAVFSFLVLIVFHNVSPYLKTKANALIVIGVHPRKVNANRRILDLLCIRDILSMRFPRLPYAHIRYKSIK